MTHNDTSHVLFSFAYLTSHKEHNLDYFHKHPGGNEARSLIHLLDNLQFWSASTWNQLKELSHKERGYEEIGVDELRTNILDNLPVALSATDKVTIFRFGESGRLAGIHPEDSPVFYVLGFDFDFSLYDHGR